MNAEQVVNKILSEAKAQAEKLVSDARARAESQIGSVKAELAEYDKQSEKLAQDAAQDKHDRMLAGARMANGKQFLAARGDILRDIFNQAKERVAAMPDDEYLDLMKSLLQKAVETGDEEVIVDKNETRISESFLKQVNSELGRGFQGNLRLAQQRGAFSGGFILTRGNISINATVDVLIDQVRQMLEPELVNTIFAKGNA